MSLGVLEFMSLGVEDGLDFGFEAFRRVVDFVV